MVCPLKCPKVSRIVPKASLRSGCGPTGSRCSTPSADRRCPQHFTKGDAMAEVALVEVSKSFGAVEAVRDLSLSIANGEFVVLLGPTGAGKTTTLRLIAGLERPDRGNVA